MNQPPSPRFRKLRAKRKLYEEMVAEMERMILDGELLEGEQLPSERELGEAFGIGRTTVREALLALQRMGLIRTSGGERARVTRPNARHLVRDLAGAAKLVLAAPEGLRHFQQARLILETALARHAAETRTAEDLTRLEAALEENRRTIEDAEAFVRTDVPFHHVLPQIVDNPIFLALYEAMTEWLLDIREQLLRAPGQTTQAYRDHVRIYEAIRDGDPDAAAHAMRAHLERVNAVYLEIKTHAAGTDRPRTNDDQGGNP